MPSQTSRDPRAWTAATIGGPAAWTVALSNPCLSFLAEYLQRLQRHSQPVANQLSEVDQAACTRELQPAIDILENGCGRYSPPPSPIGRVGFGMLRCSPLPRIR